MAKGGKRSVQKERLFSFAGNKGRPQGRRGHIVHLVELYHFDARASTLLLPAVTQSCINLHLFRLWK